MKTRGDPKEIDRSIAIRRAALRGETRWLLPTIFLILLSGCASLPSATTNRNWPAEFGGRRLQMERTEFTVYGKDADQCRKLGNWVAGQLQKSSIPRSGPGIVIAIERQTDDPPIVGYRARPYHARRGYAFVDDYNQDYCESFAVAPEALGVIDPNWPGAPAAWACFLTTDEYARSAVDVAERNQQRSFADELVKDREKDPSIKAGILRGMVRIARPAVISDWQRVDRQLIGLAREETLCDTLIRAAPLNYKEADANLANLDEELEKRWTKLLWHKVMF